MCSSDLTKLLELILSVKEWVDRLYQTGQRRAVRAVVALERDATRLLVEVAASLVFVLLRVAAERTPEIKHARVDSPETSPRARSRSTKRRCI